MGLLDDIHSQANQRRLDFLVIGGLAIIFHGHSRDTADLDLLIRAEKRVAWLELLVGLRYSVVNDARTFLQLSPPEKGAWPVDLMLVKDSTFDPMLSAAMEVEIYGVRVKIPCLEHLLALKLHALKHGHIERYSKDLLDVEALVRANALDLRSDSMRQIFLKYG